LARVLPEVEQLFGVPQRPDHHPEIDTGVHFLMVLDMSARLGAGLAVRYACLCHDLGKATTPAETLPRHLGHEQRSVTLARRLGDRLKIGTACRELAEVVAREHVNVHRCTGFGAAALLRLLERCDALRRPERFSDVLLACESDARGRLGREDLPYPPRPLLQSALRAVQAVDGAAIAADLAARAVSGPAVGEAIRAARLRALEALLQEPA